MNDRRWLRGRHAMLAVGLIPCCFLSVARFVPSRQNWNGKASPTRLLPVGATDSRLGCELARRQTRSEIHVERKRAANTGPPSGHRISRVISNLIAPGCGEGPGRTTTLRRFSSEARRLYRVLGDISPTSDRMCSNSLPVLPASSNCIVGCLKGAIQAVSRRGPFWSLQNEPIRANGGFSRRYRNRSAVKYCWAPGLPGTALGPE